MRLIRTLTLFATVTFLGLSTATRAAGQQSVTDRPSAHTDTMNMPLQVAARSLRHLVLLDGSRLPEDSSSLRQTHLVPIIYGTLGGGVLGFVAGGLLSPGAHCESCSTPASTLNRSFARGTVIGAVLGGAVVWWWTSRHE